MVMFRSYIQQVCLSFIHTAHWAIEDVKAMQRVFSTNATPSSPVDYTQQRPSNSSLAR